MANQLIKRSAYLAAPAGTRRARLSWPLAAKTADGLRRTGIVSHAHTFLATTCETDTSCTNQQNVYVWYRRQHHHMTRFGRILHSGHIPVVPGRPRGYSIQPTSRAGG